MIIQGDARHLPLADGTVQCCVTSPPYWGLRSYAGLPDSIWDGDETCAHEWVGEVPREGFLGKTRWQHTTNGRGEEQPDEKRLRTSTTRETRPEAWGEVQQGAFCRCGAWRGQYGLEPTLELYVAHTVEIFREVRRVLKDGGTLWLNLGDSFASSSTYNTTNSLHTLNGWKQDGVRRPNPRPTGSLKPKDLCGVPWRVAFALQADGWWLRSDIVWAKPNPMPESVTDRPTRSHEYIFLLAKAERYFYDALAIAEAVTGNTHSRGPEYHPMNKTAAAGSGIRANASWEAATWGPVSARNKRTVWTIATEPTPEAHFATFPQKLIEPCILAGTSEKGECSRCGANWVRVTEATGHINRREAAHVPNNSPTKVDSTGWAPTRRATATWRSTCACDAQSRPNIVLDNFLGSGTVGKVCERLGRHWVGVELSSDYIEIAKRRTQQMGLFAGMRR